MMDEFFSPTSERHSLLASMFMYRIFPLIEQNQLYAIQEQLSLVHYGNKYDGCGISLVDVDKECKVNFVDNILNMLEYVLPDFMVFNNNSFIRNLDRTRIAGQPDLVVEIWSPNNTQKIRNMKFDLYTTSEKTEHWYLEQDSDTVKCWYGKERLPNQSLTNVLITQQGLEFDLRYLALN